MTGENRVRYLRGSVLLLLAVLAWACSGGGDGEGEGLPVLYEAPEFALVDQSGDTLYSGELGGRVWIAHVFFTKCTGVCPLTTARMAMVRDSLESAGVLGEEVRLVSISVDPARETTEALRRWAERYGGSPPKEWAFLRGSSPDHVRSLVQRGFRLSAVMPADAGDDYQVTHSARALLVDRGGRVRGTYRILEKAEFEGLLEDVRRMSG